MLTWMFRRLLTGLAMAMAVVLATVAPGHAGGASGGSHRYDGADPAATGCNRNASLIATRPIKSRSTGKQVATIQIYYSWSCATNWIRVTNNPYGGNATKYIESGRGGWNSEWDAGYGASYSMMVYAPGNTHIEGYVYLFAPGVNEYNERAVGTFSL